ncbi:hypothetical protein OFL77_27440, partial [Escherichia coli]|uniref:hypothetical protein n=1 Tax=Escherichia coli TaxID=562 RepID=UPI0021DFF766
THNTSYQYRWEYGTGTLNTRLFQNVLLFNLSNFFPMKTGTGWYSQTGLKIGPFDRDVELIVLPNSGLVAYNQLYANNKQLTRLE